MSEQQFEVRESAPSPLAHALMRVGDRWTLLIVQALLAGPRRFNELLEYIPGIAANILSQRLKRLEHEALVVSRHGTARPVTTWWRTSPSLRCSFCSETPQLQMEHLFLSGQWSCLESLTCQQSRPSGRPPIVWCWV
jgi:DNA-binding HxlR family transcriptional regulator